MTTEQIWDELVHVDDICDWIEGGNSNPRAALGNCMCVAEWMAGLDYARVPKELLNPFMCWFERHRLAKRVREQEVAA